MKHCVNVIAVCICAVLFVGCQTTQSASEDEIERAYSNLGNCVYRAIPDIDDGRSNARSIAAMALTKCRTDELRYLELVAQGKSPGVASAYRQGYEVARIENATATVLELRQQNEARAKYNNKLISKWPQAVAIGVGSWRAISCGADKKSTISAANLLLVKSHPHIQFYLNSAGEFNDTAKEVFTAIEMGADRVKNGDVIECSEALSNWDNLLQR